jgi:hypothetical protein
MSLWRNFICFCFLIVGRWKIRRIVYVSYQLIVLIIIWLLHIRILIATCDDEPNHPRTGGKTFG